MSINIRFQVGDKFWHKAPKAVNSKAKRGDIETIPGIVATIVDIHKTYSSVTGELVKVRYVATHPFGNQTVTDYDVIDTTVARNFLEDNIG